MSMSTEEKIRHYQRSIDRSIEDKPRLLHCIEILSKLPVTVQHLQITGIGRTVNALRKIEDGVGDAAKRLVAKWKIMVANNDSSDEEDEACVPDVPESYESPDCDSEPESSSSQSRRNNYPVEVLNSSSFSIPSVYTQSVATSSSQVYSNSSSSKAINSDEEQSTSYKGSESIDNGRSSSHSLHSKESSRYSPNKDKSSRKDSDAKSSSKDRHSNSKDESSKSSKGSKDSDISESKRKDKHRNKSESSSSSSKHLDERKRKHELTNSSDSESDKKKRKQLDSEDEDLDDEEENNFVINDEELSLHSSSSDEEEQADEEEEQHEEEQQDEDTEEYDKNEDEEDIKESKKLSSNSHSKSKESSLKSPTYSNKDKSKEKHSSNSSHSKTKSHESSDKLIKEEKQSHSKSGDHKNKHKSSEHRSKESSKSKSSHSSSSSKDRSKDKSKDRVKEKKDKESSNKSRKEDKEKSSKLVKDDKGKCKESKEQKEQKEQKKHKDHKESKEKKKSKRNKEGDGEGGIDCNSGTSFADALGMCTMLPPSKKKKDNSISTNVPKPNRSNQLSPTPSTPSSSKSSTSKVKTEPPDSPESLPLLSSNVKLEPLNRINEEVDLASTLPEPSPHYRPLPYINPAQRRQDEDHMLAQVIYAKNQRTKVFSGNKIGYTNVPSLYDMCIRVLIENIDALEFTGGVPYYILKPVLERASPDQLFILEHHNPYLIEDTDPLWQFHCNKDFRSKQREEMESWREMYMRCLDEREAKLKALTANIKQSIDKSQPVRSTKLAYVDNIVKPPRNVLRKQAKYGTANVTTKSTDLKKKLITGGINSGSSTSSSNSSGTASTSERISVPPPFVPRARSSTAPTFKKTKAPLMAKALQAIKGRYKR